MIPDILYFYVLTDNSITRSNFNLRKLDVIKAAKYIFNFHEKTYNEFCIYQAMNISIYSALSYYHVSKSDYVDKDVILKSLIDDFEFYYQFYKKDKNNIKVGIKFKLLTFIFNISPKFCNFIIKILKKVQRLLK